MSTPPEIYYHERRKLQDERADTQTKALDTMIWETSRGWAVGNIMGIWSLAMAMRRNPHVATPFMQRLDQVVFGGVIGAKVGFAVGVAKVELSGRQ